MYKYTRKKIICTCICIIYISTLDFTCGNCKNTMAPVTAQVSLIHFGRRCPLKFGKLTVAIASRRILGGFTSPQTRNSEAGAPCVRASSLPSRCALHPTPYTLHPIPNTLHSTPSTLHPTPYPLHPTPYTMHPTPLSSLHLSLPPSLPGSLPPSLPPKPSLRCHFGAPLRCLENIM